VSMPSHVWEDESSPWRKRVVGILIVVAFTFTFAFAIVFVFAFAFVFEFVVELPRGIV